MKHWIVPERCILLDKFKSFDPRYFKNIRIAYNVRRTQVREA